MHNKKLLKKQTFEKYRKKLVLLINHIHAFLYNNTWFNTKKYRQNLMFLIKLKKELMFLIKANHLLYITQI